MDKERGFYRRVLAIALPIMIQNGITNFVNLLDNIMVGQLGVEQMADWQGQAFLQRSIMGRRIRKAFRIPFAINCG